MKYRNNNTAYINDEAYSGAEHEELLKFFTKELNELGSLGGPSSYSIEAKIQQLQIELAKARKREEIAAVLDEYDLQIYTMPDSVIKDRIICFIGNGREFSNHFAIPEQEAECEE